LGNRTTNVFIYINNKQPKNPLELITKVLLNHFMMNGRNMMLK